MAAPAHVGGGGGLCVRVCLCVSTKAAASDKSGQVDCFAKSKEWVR